MKPFVYIMGNRRNGTLYIGVTSDLPSRIWQHRTGAIVGFTHRYQLTQLFSHEQHATMESAILREKQLKGGNRARKIERVESLNPDWRDLYPDIVR